MRGTDHARLENRKSSSGRKIARMTGILMKFGPKKSQRRRLFDEKFSNERSERKVPEKIEKLSKNIRKILKIDIADVINY